MLNARTLMARSTPVAPPYTQDYTSGSVVVPAGYTKADILVIGGGGGTSSTGNSRNGGGGGGSAIALDTLVTGGETLTAVQGAAGTPGVSGGTSSLSRGGTVLASASGGIHGGSTRAGGAGSVGGTLYSGAAGASNGNGGGAAGATGNGSGQAGNTPGGNGGDAGLADVEGYQIPQTAGVAYGGGGGGGAGTVSFPMSGMNGAVGLVRITWHN